MVKIKSRLIAKKREPRDFDVNPLTVKVEGHTLIAFNNEVWHVPSACRGCKT